MGKDPVEQRNRTRSRRKDRAGSPVADWASVPAELLRDAICAAAAVGGALRFGYSRDGGAYAVGIYGDGSPYTEFFGPAEDITTELLDIKEFFEDEKADRALTELNAKGKKAEKTGKD